MNTLVINCLGGPGAGKTTAAWHMASELKKKGYVVEYVPEYAKELVWDNRMDMLSGNMETQRAVLDEQERRIARLVGKVQFVVTDSPILLNALYLQNRSPEQKEKYENMVAERFNRYNNFNMFVNRGEHFETAGRIHDENASRQKDEELKDFLRRHDVYYGLYDHQTIEKAIRNCETTLRKLPSLPDIYERRHRVENRKNKTRLFVDMDGTLAAFQSVNKLETLYEKGYFEHLPPMPNMLEAVRELVLHHPELDVHILSSYLADSPYALTEKNAWLDKYLPEVPAEKRIFPPCGRDKKDFVPDGIKNTDVLLDDYSKNLHSWEPPGMGIKVRNGINGTRGTWRAAAISCLSAPQELAMEIAKYIGNGPAAELPQQKGAFRRIENGGEQKPPFQKRLIQAREKADARQAERNTKKLENHREASI